MAVLENPNSHGSRRLTIKLTDAAVNDVRIEN
jgi:hypothetical protein